MPDSVKQAAILQSMSLSLINSVVRNHVKFAKHQAGKTRLAAKEVSEIAIAKALKTSDQVAHRDT